MRSPFRLPHIFGDVADYRAVLHIGEGRHALAFNDTQIEKAADRWDWLALRRSIAYRLPRGTDRLFWGREAIRIEQLFERVAWPPFLSFDLDPPRGEFAEKCALVIRLLDGETNALFSGPIRLNKPRQLLVPVSSETRGLIFHIRLQGQGILPPLHLTLSIPQRISGEAPEGQRRGLQRQLISGSQLRGAQLSAHEASLGRFPWQDILHHSRGHRDRGYSIGVVREAAYGSPDRFRYVRADESVRAHLSSHCRQYVFDDAEAERRFGWSAVMTPDNNLANAALAQHLDMCRQADLQTVLVYGEATRRKPLLKDFAERFDILLPAQEIEDLFGSETQDA